MTLLRALIALVLMTPPTTAAIGRVKDLAALEGVAAVHDLHVWPMSTTETALTAHLVMPQRPASDAFLHTVTEGLRARFGVHHATIQIESGEHPCDAPCEAPC